MSTIGIIPSRYASTRFPGKPLIDINGKSMIQRVYEQASASSLQKVFVATDDNRIFDHVKSFGGQVIMTSEKHQSGTDRCAEVASLANLQPDDVVINIQGDEPYINPSQIDLLATCFSKPDVTIATLIKKIDTIENLLDVNLPKVIIDKDNKAIYFSRHAIPFQAKVNQNEWLNNQVYYRHIGIYGYRVNTLLHISKLPVSLLEKAESLEQQNQIKFLLPIIKAQKFIQHNIFSSRLVKILPSIEI
jgi:3-deoxy-manno-octulosonate cytidylyltransferase (CMP-KDO synthetase)